MAFKFALVGRLIDVPTFADRNRNVSPFGSRQRGETRKSHETTRKMQHCSLLRQSANCPKPRGHEPCYALPHVIWFRTMLFFRVFSCDFRVTPRCRDPKGETTRLKVGEGRRINESPHRSEFKSQWRRTSSRTLKRIVSVAYATRRLGGLLCVARSARALSL